MKNSVISVCSVVSFCSEVIDGSPHRCYKIRMATIEPPAPSLSPASEWLPVIVERIVRRFAPVRIILFGSHARGEARPDSDLDLLVVLPQVANKRQAAVNIGNELSDLPVSKDIVVTTPEEIAQRGDVIGLVLRPALREGKVIYERT